MKNKKNQKGVSLIAAIFIIVVLAFMGVMFLSMINTSTLTSVNDVQSTQALYIAEGGVEFEQRILAQNVDWYRSADPVDNTTLTLGSVSGSFTARTNIPATALQRRFLIGGTTIFVYSTGRFTPPGCLQIDGDVAGNLEYVRYTAVTAGPPATFTGLTRGTCAGITTASVAADHFRPGNVYPVTNLVDALLASCNTPTTFRIGSNTKFLSAGTLDIQGEEISYTGSSTSGGNMTLTGVRRCRGAVGPVPHAVNDPVTPVLDGGDTADNEAEITSTGTVGAAVRTVKKTVRRGP